MRRALRSLALVAALGAVALGQQEVVPVEEQEVAPQDRDLQAGALGSAFSSAASGAAAGANAGSALGMSGDSASVANSLVQIATKNFMNSGWGQQLSDLATGAQDAKDSGDAQDFLDKMINQASPEGVNGEPSTLFTMNLNSNPITTQANFERLYTQLFGTLPTTQNFDGVFKPKSFEDFVGSVTNLVGTAAGSGASGFSTTCAWTVTVDTTKFNFALPDKNSVYHAHLLKNFGADDMLVIEGEFPDVRYFSFQTYDDNYDSVDGLRDHQIVPFNGTNPWLVPTKDKTTNGKYRIYVTKDGKSGFPNEIAVSKNNLGSSSTAFLLFRMYADDVHADTTQTNSKVDLSKWGWKAPPTVSYKASSGGLLVANTGMKLTTLPLCSGNNTDIAAQALKTYQDLNGPGNQTASKCQAENVKDAWILYVRGSDAEGTSRAPFSNADANYLVACANNRNPTVGANDLVAVVRNYLPKTPYSKYQSRFTGDVVDTDVRYVSFSLYDLKVPGPNIDTLYDKDFHDFYYDMYGGDKWEGKFGRNVSLVVARNAETLQRCGISTEKSLTMFLEREDPESGKTIEPPQWWGIVYREIVPQSAVINDTAALKQYGLKPDKIYKKSVANAKSIMCPTNTNCDSNPWRVGSIMKEHFPRIDWYYCGQDGTLTVAPSGTNPYDTNYKLSDGPDMDDVYWADFCDSDTNQGLLKVYAPSTVSAHYYQQKVNVSQANHLLAYPISVKTSQKHIVIGVQVLASNPQDAYFKADVFVCGYTYVSDPTKWRCSNGPVPDDSWLTADFDDSAWDPATVASPDDPTYQVAGVDLAADWITATYPSTITVCRTVVPNPTYLG